MNKIFKILISFVFVLLFAFTSIGYAALSQDFAVKGYILMNEQTGVYILTVNVVDDDTNSIGTINSYAKTILNNRVELGNYGNSIVTYEITVKNNDTEPVGYNDMIYSTEFYDNENIVYTLYSLSEDPQYGLSKKDEPIPVGSYRTFRVHIGYKDGVSINDNILNSVVNFQFMHWDDIFIEDIIPDSPEDNRQGLNHMSLLEAIIGPEHGLNGPSGSTLNKAISQRTEAGRNEIGGAQHMTGSTLKKVLQSAGNINVNYIIHLYSDHEYHVYSWNIADAKKVGSIISVYKTKLINLDGEWVIGAAEEGTAEVVDYAKFYQGKTSGGESTSIDYGSFVANPTPIE